MPKKKTVKTQREMTHHQLTHWQKEKRLQRITFITGIALILAIILIIGTGFYMSKYRPLHQVVLKIGKTEFNMDYFINTLTNLGIKNADASQHSMYTSIALQSIEQSNLLVEAAASGYDNISPVKISDDEITKYISDNKLPKDKVTRDAVHRQLLTDKLKADWFSPQIPATAEHRQIWAMQLGSQAQVDQVKVRLANGESFTDLAAVMSADPTTKEKKGDLGWFPKGVLSTVLNNAGTSSLDDAFFSAAKNEVVTFQDSSVKNPGYWLIKVTETKDNDTKAHIYAMLLGSSKEAQDIGLKLATGGDGNDWDSLAKANSQYTNASTDGGDLGFVAKGTLGEAIDAAVFSSDGKVTLGLNNVIGPLEDSNQTTKGPVWLFQVNGIEERVVGETDRSTLTEAKASAWFQKYWTANQDKITDLLDTNMIQFAIDEALKR